MLIPSRPAQSGHDLIMVMVDCRLRLPTNPEKKKTIKESLSKTLLNFSFNSFKYNNENSLQ